MHSFFLLLVNEFVLYSIFYIPVYFEKQMAEVLQIQLQQRACHLLPKRIQLAERLAPPEEENKFVNELITIANIWKIWILHC